MNYRQGFQYVALDTHIYTMFTNQAIAYTDAQRTAAFCAMAPSLRNSNNNLWTIVGEWTAATTDCAVSSNLSLRSRSSFASPLDWMLTLFSNFRERFLDSNIAQMATRIVSEEDRDTMEQVMDHLTLEIAQLELEMEILLVQLTKRLYELFTNCRLPSTRLMALDGLCGHGKWLASFASIFEIVIDSSF